MRRVLLLVVALVLLAAPAGAATNVYGHRIKEGPSAGTNENTLTALRWLHRHHGLRFEADMWNLATGEPVIFHDATLNRVVDPASYPPGVSGSTLVRSLTLDQFHQLRTRGGEPLLTAESLIRHAGRWGLRGIIEVKYAPVDPAQIMGWVRESGARVSFYGTPHLYRGHCYRTGVQRMRDAGATVGLKVSSVCPVTLEESAAFGDSYVIGPIPDATYVGAAHALGLKVGNYNSGQRATWTRLRGYGVDWLLSPHPLATKRWLRDQPAA